MESRIVQEWLAALARTANARDYPAHMDLISKEVKVYGVPGFEVIDYDDWARQCQHEFEAGLLKRVTYEGLKVRTMTPGSVMFKVKETDGKWRVVQERMLAADELEFDGGRLQ